MFKIKNNKLKMETFSPQKEKKWGIYDDMFICYTIML